MELLPHHHSTILLKLTASIAAAATVLFVLSLSSKPPIDASHPRARQLKARGQHSHRALPLQQYQDPQSTEVRTIQDASSDSSLLVTCPNRDEPVPISDFYSYDPEICYHDFTDTVFFHVGKGGGGTIKEDFEIGRIGVPQSHPRPVPEFVKGLKTGPIERLVINIRDPVDRFVSSFYWHLFRCDPSGPYVQNSEYLANRCNQHGGETMWKLMSEKYKSNANVLAEAMCEESSSFQQTKADYSVMDFFHKMPLTTWLDFLIDPAQKDSINAESGIQQIFAVPMEKPHMDGQETPFLEHHVQQLTFLLLEERYGTEAARALMMHAPKEKEGNMQHSTKSMGTTAPLSVLGECCMARRLRGDYRLIQSMLGTNNAGNGAIVEPLIYAHPTLSGACSWGTEDEQELCRSDLVSILSRRAQYLDLSLGTCSSIVSNVVVTEG